MSARAIPRVPALRGKTVVSLFFEDSTRTRLSFETAARRLSADAMTFSVSSSSINKGESLRDTVETIEAMGIDAVVVRHAGSGVPWQVARWLHGPSVVNAGDGWHEHPTQALLDCYTIRRNANGAARSARARASPPWPDCRSPSSATFVGGSGTNIPLFAGVSVALIICKIVSSVVDRPALTVQTLESLRLKVTLAVCAF